MSRSQDHSAKRREVRQIDWIAENFFGHRRGEQQRAMMQERLQNVYSLANIEGLIQSQPRARWQRRIDKSVIDPRCGQEKSNDGKEH